jgi:hypothetical protein
LYVGSTSAVDPGTGNIIATGNITAADSTISSGTLNATATFQRSGVAGGIFVPAIPPFFAVDTASNTWDGSGTRGAGAYYVRLSTNGIPAGAVAVAVRLAGYWATAAAGNYCCVEIYGTTNPSLVIRSSVNGMYADGCGIVIINSQIYFDLRVAGATMNGPVCQIVGWYV